MSFHPIYPYAYKKEYSTSEDDTADESNTVIVVGGSSGSGINSTNIFNQATTETVSLYNNNLSDSETVPVVKKNKKKPYSQIN